MLFVATIPDPVLAAQQAMANAEAIARTAIVWSFIMGIAGLMLAVLSFAAWIWAFVHCLKHRHDKDRTLWAVVTFGGGPFGAVIYFIWGRNTVPAPTQIARPARRIFSPAPVASTVAPCPSGPELFAGVQAPPLPSRGQLEVAVGPFDRDAMFDEKKRAQAIIEACWANGASRRKLGK